MVFLTPNDWLWTTCAEVRCLGAQGFPQDFNRETKTKLQNGNIWWKQTVGF